LNTKPHKAGQADPPSIVDESTTLFEDQVVLVKEIARKTGLKKAVIYRHALDLYFTFLKPQIKSLRITIPKRLSRRNLRDFKKHTQSFTRNEF